MCAGFTVNHGVSYASPVSPRDGANERLPAASMRHVGVSLFNAAAMTPPHAAELLVAVKERRRQQLHDPRDVPGSHLADRLRRRHADVGVGVPQGLEEGVAVRRRGFAQAAQRDHAPVAHARVRIL